MNFCWPKETKVVRLTNSEQRQNSPLPVCEDAEKMLLESIPGKKATVFRTNSPPLSLHFPENSREFKGKGIHSRLQSSHSFLSGGHHSFLSIMWC